jgi:hypothetical protein
LYLLHDDFFLDKEYILISTDTNYIQPLQQRSALVAIRMHTAKKRRELQKKKKARYSDKFLVAATLTPPRQHQKFNISKKQRLQEGSSALTPSSPDQRS